MAADLPRMFFATQSEWFSWLEQNHTEHGGLWIQFAKKGTGIASLNYAEAIEVALCHGWIDGQVRKLNERYFIQRFVPRRPDSIWSQINQKKALDLIERGLMKPAGFAAIERAKANGRWDSAYHSPSKATVPADLQAALDASPMAAAFFKTLTGSNRYAILFRLQTAKKPETRIARISKFIGMFERGETIY